VAVTSPKGGNRIYATTGYGGHRVCGYGRTWRGNRFLGGGAVEVVAAGVDLGLSYDSPSAYYEYPDNAYGYNSASASGLTRSTPTRRAMALGIVRHPSMTTRRAIALMPSGTFVQLCARLRLDSRLCSRPKLPLQPMSLRVRHWFRGDTSRGQSALFLARCLCWSPGPR